MIRAYHHVAYRCRDSEETRRFYEDFLGLELAATKPITETQTGRVTSVLHTFYRLGDGSFLAFFEVPDSPFDFKAQHDFDLHVALEVDEPTLERMAEHGVIRSIYLRDPNGYVVELTAKTAIHDTVMDPRSNGAREKLDRWQAEKVARAA